MSNLTPILIGIALMVAAVFGASYCGVNECRASDLHVWFFGDAAKTMNVLTFVLVVIAVWQIAEARASGRQQAQDTIEALKISRDSADAATKANELTQHVFAASERPWVSLQAQLMGGLTVEESGIFVPVRFIVKNVGSSPACFVAIHSKIHCVPGFHSVTEQARMIQAASARPPKQIFGSFVLFPGEEKFQNHTQGLSIEEIRTWSLGGVTPPRLMPSIIGFVEYHSLLDQSRHYTGFVLDLHRVNPQYPGQSFAIDVLPEGLPQAHLSLNLSLLGSSAT